MSRYTLSLKKKKIVLTKITVHILDLPGKKSRYGPDKILFPTAAYF